MRACSTPGCPTLHPGPGRCPTCRTQANRQRATPEQRGYNAAHRKLRAHYSARQAQGHTLTCARCGDPIRPDEPFDLGHTDDRTDWTGPEHRDRCNRAAAGRIGAAIVNPTR